MHLFYLESPPEHGKYITVKAGSYLSFHDALTFIFVWSK